MMVTAVAFADCQFTEAVPGAFSVALMDVVGVEQACATVRCSVSGPQTAPPFAAGVITVRAQVSVRVC